jgi:myo-inositol-1(or 4)-monophosphatase
MISSRVTVRSAVINVMAGAVQKAGRGLVRDFGELEHLQVSKKGLGDFVSTADHRAEKILIQELKKARPGYGFLVEESGEIPGEDPSIRWIIDPLDGTTNFLHGIPHFAISVALQKDKEIVAGVIYNPIADEMFWAEKGKGAYLNNRRLRVSGRRYLDEALLATGTPFGSRGNSRQFLKMMENIMPKTAGLRRMGAATLDLAFVAAGRYEGYFETHLSPWDIAAGMLLVIEAGGYVSEINGGKDMLDSGNVLAANDCLFSEIQKVLLT